MNTSVYLFGKFNSGYTQCPNDSTSEIFSKFHEAVKSTTQIAIHRHENLMYYGYIRKLEEDRYIGMCVVLNGLYLKCSPYILFSLFENIVTWLVVTGQLIRFNEYGNIVSGVDKLSLEKEKVDSLNELLRIGFNRFSSDAVSLPAESYGTQKDSVKQFLVDDKLENIIQSSYTNGYTYVYKHQGFNTDQMKSYIGVLMQVNSEKKELQEKYEKLGKKHAETLREKKQVKYVIYLIFALVVVGLIGLSLNHILSVTKNDLSVTKNDLSVTENNLSVTENNLSVARRDLANANDSIVRLCVLNSDLHSENLKLEQDLQMEYDLRMKAENALDELNNTIANHQPFLVKGTSFNYNSGYLILDYYGVADEVINVSVRIYRGDRYICENSSDMHIKPGNHSQIVYVKSNLNSIFGYSFEILIGNTIVGGVRR